MGILYNAIKVPKLLTFSFFLNVIANGSYFLIGALTRLGLYKPPPGDAEQENAGFNSYTLIVDSSSPSLVPVPVHVITRAIKRKLPILQYRDLEEEEEEAKEEISSISEERVGTGCTVCLDSIEASHEVRELCNCKHLFHRECLDKWIDEGRITCPLCRSMLLPPRTILEWYYRSSREEANDSNSSSVASS